MMVVWITLLFLHHAYTLAPVTTVKHGEPATLTCVSPGIKNKKLYWYKQRAGETLKLIVMQQSAKTTFEEGFPASKFKVVVHQNMSNLNILNTREEDEGIYHCAVIEWIKIAWSTTYLSITGHSDRASNLTVVQQSSVSDPVRPGDLLTLQCSVLSDSAKTCPGGQSVFWFRAGSNRSHPDVIYTGKKLDKCENRPDSVKSCDYHFSKNFSSSDAGTYYCAVDTCGHILFGSGTTVTSAQTSYLELITMVILTGCLVISVTGNVFLLLKQKQQNGLESAVVEAPRNNTCQEEHDTDNAVEEVNYAALNFSAKAARGRKRREFAEDSVYAQVRC